jgi:AcrR family transcriptional regulator
LCILEQTNNQETQQVKPARKDGLETKQRLVDAAERLFAEQGVEKVKLVDVSREAGQKNRNAAQYHFGDRAGLINAVLDKHSEIIADQRRNMLAQLAQNPSPTMRELVEALVLPVANHAQSDPNGLTYLMLNRQLTNSGQHMVLSWKRVDNLPEVMQLQRLMKERMPVHRKDAMQAKMMLIHCMLFNGLANFCDLKPTGSNRSFVNTLCASIVAVLLEESS